MILTRSPFYQFSLSKTIAKKTFDKFTSKHTASLEAFRQKLESTKSSKVIVQRSTQKPYVHPSHDAHHPVYSSTTKWLQAINEVAGPEQVSPHYEHFSFARRHALTFWGGLLLLRFVATTEDIFWIAQQSTQAWVFLFAYLYFYTQGKKYFLMPMLSRFYSKIAIMELNNLETYYQQNVQARCRNLMALAKTQIEYKSVHNEYLSIRNNSLLNFMINEQISLKNHLHERAQAILKQAEQIEQANQNRIISDVMSQTLKSVDIAYANNKAKIEEQFFEIALQGIAKGRMSFEKDPILPYVLQTINQTVEKFNKISPQQQNKLVCISEDQMQQIRANDARARDEFLNNQPKIDGSLRNNQIVGKILNRWGQN